MIKNSQERCIMRLSGDVSRLAVHCATVAFLLTLVFSYGCNGGSGQPPVKFTIDYGNFRLDLPTGDGGDTEREFVLYAGAPATSFQINLRATGLPASSTVFVGTGRGSLVETLTQTSSNLEASDENANPLPAAGADGRLATRTISGNVGRLRVRIPSSSLFTPEIVIESLAAIRPASFFTPPVLVAEMADSVTALPVKPGQPVDLGFPAAPTTYYLSVSGISDPEVDVALFGTGRFRVNDSRDFPLADDTAVRVLPASGNSPLIGFARQKVPSSGMLTFAVTNEGANPATGHARFVVLSLAPSLRLSFPSTQPGQFLPGNIGIDYDSAKGTRGPGGGSIDCLNWEDKRGVKQVVGLWLPVFQGGLPICYDDHPGMDFLLPLSFIQQQLLVPASAASPGIVLGIEDGNADTCFANPLNGFTISCPDSTLPSNFIAVRQEDGLFAYYVHVRRQLVTVRPGERVVCGQRLGSVGSAGQSATSHLHFELRRLRGETFNAGGLSSYHFFEVRNKSEDVDPFKTDLWRRVTNGMPESQCN